MHRGMGKSYIYNEICQGLGWVVIKVPLVSFYAADKKRATAQPRGGN